MELSSSDQQTTARSTACDTTEEELVRSSWRANLWRCRSRAAMWNGRMTAEEDGRRTNDGLKTTVDKRRRLKTVDDGRPTKMNPDER